jgi:hypothetical protein
MNADLNSACTKKKQEFLLSGYSWVKKNAQTTQLSTHVAQKLKVILILTEVLSSFPQFLQGGALTVP